ncbi:histidine phosphatase family protein [Ovoidimarina sediminis]|uniref:histidine phosphatase family protein n=1 Tax=Ovoidimarina sediminis TaxID=3079856 RepID=UPI00290BB9A0|nr:histidine phosphatase family protein [Rhodophyticola sp. MJ-SS7]MDU8946469.1 histidine phosphatase family protein [Rhodophyticola sp. MJ-SS7]
MPRLIFITHPEVEVDPNREISDWGLSEEGRRRATIFARSDVFASATHVWSSPEMKAHQTAAILSAPKRLPISVNSCLRENDRSATGFLPPLEFEAAANAFFSEPETSFRGWETAVDAQARVEGAVRQIVATHSGEDLAIVAHGAVGTLLWCSLRGVPIDGKYDQPSQGHYWAADITALRPDTRWLPIA